MNREAQTNLSIVVSHFNILDGVSDKLYWGRMAIYSGFATRKQEERYDGLVKKLLETLSQIVITYVESIKI